MKPYPIYSQAAQKHQIGAPNMRRWVAISPSPRNPQVNPTRMKGTHNRNNNKLQLESEYLLALLIWKGISSPSSNCHVRRREEYLNYSDSPTGDLTTCLNFPLRQDRKEYIFFTTSRCQTAFTEDVCTCRGQTASTEPWPLAYRRSEERTDGQTQEITDTSFFHSFLNGLLIFHLQRYIFYGNILGSFICQHNRILIHVSFNRFGCRTIDDPV